MKTAISIPDEVFNAAESTAKRLGMSRSQLYANAVREYIEVHLSGQITEKLDQVYGSESESLDPNIAKMQLNTLKQDKW
ncbi:MAG: hypothetical protein ACNYPE_09660 [Candidatus Azotimanducaceae bacterium WSBS_2022_MAG_OTU7]